MLDSRPSSAACRDAEPTSADRFRFGENWAAFLSVLDDERIEVAERSLQDMLERHRLDGLTFMDIGSGSGLMSLAAWRLGATRVHSLDLDPSSVACTQELRRRYAPDATDAWTIESASALDAEHLRSLGRWDIVYSWGVLHHTGEMWSALENVAESVAPDGRLFIAIYNDQGRRSRMWRRIKRMFNRLPEPLRIPYAVLVMLPRELRSLTWHSAKLTPRTYIDTWTKRSRGMSRWHDLIDWVGGYPYEVATPQEIFDFYRQRRFTLTRLVTRPGLGCNEFVFARLPDAEPSQSSHASAPSTAAS